MARAGHDVLILALGQGKTRLAPECAHRRGRGAVPRRSSSRRPRSARTRSPAPHSRVRIERAVLPAVEKRGMALAHGEALANDMQLGAAIGELGDVEVAELELAPEELGRKHLARHEIEAVCLQLHRPASYPRRRSYAGFRWRAMTLRRVSARTGLVT